jgi:hypothetical protein
LFADSRSGIHQRVRRASPFAIVCAALAGAVSSAPTVAGAVEPNIAGMPEERSYSDEVRLRIGFDTSAGTLLGGGDIGYGFALRIRTGVQMGRYFAITVQNTTFVLVDPSRVHFPSEVGVLLEHGMMFHVTPIDAVDLGIGASLDFAQTRSAFAPDGTEAAPADGLMFALTARVALNLGKTNPATGRRVAFTFGVQPHIVFAPLGPAVVVTAGPGAEWY